LCANWQKSSSVKGLEGNPKFQAQNSKQTQKLQNPNVPNRTFLNLEFWIWNLFRPPWWIDIRISDFSLPFLGSGYAGLGLHQYGPVPVYISQPVEQYILCVL